MARFFCEIEKQNGKNDKNMFLSCDVCEILKNTCLLLLIKQGYRYTTKPTPVG